MKFDLISILKILDKHFGNDAELLLFQDNFNINIRIIVYVKNTKFKHQFLFPKNQIDDSFVLLMNIYIYRAIKSLENQINYHEENN